MSEQHWTAEENHNYDPPWIIRYDPTPGGRMNEDGSISHSLNFPALQLTDWVAEKEEAASRIARALNSQPELLEALRGLANALELEAGPRGVMDLVPGAIEKARAAIARAEGLS